MKASTLFLISVALAAASSVANANASAPFAAQLFHAIAQGKSAENVVVSPASIATCLALAYLGAGGETASELQNGLQLSDAADKQQVAQQFGQLFEKTRAGSEATLKVANRIYVGANFALSAKFNALAAQYFRAEAKNVDFAQAADAAAQINAWVEQQTENKIQQLVSADSLDGSTGAVLVNAVYFKAKWTNIFDAHGTTKQDFVVSQTRSVPVDMMFQEDHFLYGDLKDLDATAVELGYLDTDIAMLVLLPKSADGLPALEQKLQDVDLTKLSAQLEREKVRLRLPRFRIEFDVSLQPALEQLGMTTMFTARADFSELLASEQPLQISEVKHKAFIEVNEQGTEAAGATYAKAVLTSLIIGETVYDFNADHPFFFALKDKDTVYFVGHVSNF